MLSLAELKRYDTSLFCALMGAKVAVSQKPNLDERMVLRF
jgi:hypothetical protein